MFIVRKSYKSTIVQNIIGIVFLCVGIAFSLIAVFTLISKILIPASSDVSLILFITFISIGLPFLITGAIFKAYVIKTDKREALLVSEGRRISGTVVDYRTNWVVTLNRRHPVKLICEYNDFMSESPKQYVSGNYWDDPENTLNKSVSIYIDRLDENNYYVDISDL